MPEQRIKVVEAEDNVGTFLRDAEAGETVEIPIGDGIREVTLNDDIPFGHKVALRDVDEGTEIVKYGTSIGYASEAIAAGDWVHVHNVESNYGRGDLAQDGAARAAE